jgi:hypothetical protein
VVLPYLKAIFLYACFDSEDIKTSLYQVTIAFVAAFLKEDKVTLRKRKIKEKKEQTIGPLPLLETALKHYIVPAVRSFLEKDQFLQKERLQTQIAAG